MRSLIARLRRSIVELSYVGARRKVFWMLQALRYTKRRAAAAALLAPARHHMLLKDSGLRLMVYRAHRDPADWHSECYFGRNYLGHPVQRVVDVGAYRGSWSWACYCLLRPQVIHMYEPNPALQVSLLDLKRRMAGSTVEIRPVIVGERWGRVNYYMTSSPLLNSVLPLDPVATAPLGSYAASVDTSTSITQVSLDEEIPNSAEIDFLKIDCQGYEMPVLRGAVDTLRRTRAIMIEMNFVPIYQRGSTFLEVHNVLGSLGFNLVQLDAPSRSNGRMVWTDALYVANRLMD
jgi:FkbM family methyltransferase